MEGWGSTGREVDYGDLEFMVHQSWRFCDSLLRCSAVTSMEKLTVGCIRVESLLGGCNHRSDPWELKFLAQYLKSQRFP